MLSASTFCIVMAAFKKFIRGFRLKNTQIHFLNTYRKLLKKVKKHIALCCFGNSDFGQSS